MASLCLAARTDGNVEFLFGYINAYEEILGSHE